MSGKLISLGTGITLFESNKNYQAISEVFREPCSFFSSEFTGLKEQLLSSGSLR